MFRTVSVKGWLAGLVIGLPGICAAQPAAACAAAVAVRDSTGTALGDATVALGDALHRTDATGDARFTVGSSTPIHARIRRIGYAPARVMLFPTCGAAPTATTVTLDPIATRLSTVTVSATQRPVYSGPLASFYERRAKGDGVFFTHADMFERNAQRLSDVLRTVNGLGETGRRATVPGRGTRGVGERCYPLLVIDGMAQANIGEIRTDGIDPRGLAGVEVYPDASRTPPEFLALNNGSRCGTIAIWSRRFDTYGPESRDLPIAALPDSLVFGEGDVDALAQLDTARSVEPVYPASLRRKALDGEVQVELVVGSDGRPYPRSARVLNTTHKAFGEAVIDGLPLLTFEPARRNDQAVAQRIRMTIAFRASEP
ncbi:MAG: TonB family protein [Gemmatimonadaceae bacterium]|nr:TonB family protein [Gemmatimonadaceae bacterium]